MSVDDTGATASFADQNVGTAKTVTSYNRLLRPGLAQVLPNEAVPNTILRRRFDQLDAAIDQWLEQQNMAA